MLRHRFTDGTYRIDPAHRGAAVAIGNFDGVHLGHQAVIDQTRKTDMPLGVLTFEPHPRAFFAPDAPDFRLMTAATRAARLETLGVDHVYEMPFDGALAGLSVDAFINDILIDALGIRHVTVGADFRFGKGRAGDGAALASQTAFTTTIADLVQDAAVEVSSTAIRAALAEGRPKDAARMLGHWHRIEGPVLHGFKRGREMEFPTANLSLDGLHLPKFGVYAVLADIKSGPHAGRYHGAASVGVRPTFEGDDRPNIETFLFDFDGDIYDEWLSVGLIAFQRPEIAYEGMAPLMAQMKQDCIDARAILAQL